MSYTAESVVVELLAKTDSFDGKVKTSAAGFDSSMKKIESSAKGAENQIATTSERAGRSLARIQQSTRNLGFQISDVGTQLSAGTSPFLILAQQGPQVANALDGAKGAVGRFAGFLSGPWGAALLAAISILGIFIQKNLKLGDEIDAQVAKLKKQARELETARLAADKFAKSEEGVTQAILDQQEALKIQEKELRSAAERAVEAARANLSHEISIRNTTKALLEQAVAQVRIDKIRAQAPGQRGENATLSLDVSSSRVAGLQTQIDKQEELIKKAQTNLGTAQSFLDVERGTESTEDGIRRRYADRIESARKLAAAQGKVGEALERQVRALEKARDAEIERAREAERERNRRGNNAETGREVTPKEAAGIARAAGLQVNSSSRTFAEQKRLYDAWVAAGKPADNPVAMPGSSAHEGAKGRWALDIQFGAGVTPELLRKVFAAQGISLSKVFKERGHFHIEGSRSQSDSAEDATAKAAEEELRRRQAFENELASLQGDEIDARRQLVVAAEEIAALEVQAIELSRKKYADNLDSLVEQKKLTGAEAKELRKLNDARAELRTELVQRREDQRKFRVAEAEAERKLQTGLASAQVEEDRLRSAEGVATTARARRDIEQRLINLQFDEEKLQLQAVIARRDRLKIELERLATQRALSDDEKAELRQADDRAKDAEDRLGTLPDRQRNAGTTNNRQNASPVQDFFNSIPQTGDEINEALENIAAGGLRTFTDALTDAIVNFKSLGDVGLVVLRHLTTEMVRLALQQIILRTLGKTLGASAVATTAAEASAAGAAWAVPAALASLATLGANAGPAAAAIAATTALAMALGATPKRDGGPIFGPGGPTDDKVLVAASDGEYMIRSRSAAKLGRGVLDHINSTGELPVRRASGGAIGAVRPSNAAAAPVGSSGAGGMSEEHLNRLELAMRDAVASMPPVNLFPTMHPVKALEAMLNSPGGSRMFFDFVAQNAGKMNAQLQR
jgi:hypothetical protein